MLEDHRFLPEAERALCRREMPRFGSAVLAVVTAVPVDGIRFWDGEWSGC